MGVMIDKHHLFFKLQHCVGCKISNQKRKLCYLLNSPKNFQSLDSKIMRPEEHQKICDSSEDGEAGAVPEQILNQTVSLIVSSKFTSKGALDIT